MRIVPCSLDKFMMMFSNAISLKRTFEGAKKNRNIPMKTDFDKHTYEYPDSVRYENGLKVYKDYTENGIVYWLNNSVIYGCDDTHTKIYFAEDGGIQTIILGTYNSILVATRNEETSENGVGNIVLCEHDVRPREWIEELILSELTDTENVLYTDGLVKTKLFTGSYTNEGVDYLNIRIEPVSDRVVITELFCDSLEGTIATTYIALLNINTNKIVGDTLYEKVCSLAGKGLNFSGLIECKYNEYAPESTVIDLKNNDTVLLKNAEVEIIGKNIIVKRKRGRHSNSVAVYQFDSKERKLLTVMPEIMHTYVDETKETLSNYNRYKTSNNTRTIKYNSRGFKAKQGLFGKEAQRTVLILENGVIKWIDKHCYEKVKDQIDVK